MLSTVGEHDGKQPSGFEPLLKQPGDSPFEREGFPRAGSGDDSDAARLVRCDSIGGRGRIELVVPGHGGRAASTLG